MNPIQWLENNIPNFKELPEPDRQAIFHFTLLWSLFEAKALETHASPPAIIALVHEWAAKNRLEVKLFEASLEYFQQRYFVDGKPTRHFGGLHLRHNDSPGLVRAVLQGENTNASDCVAALIIVVYRLRNNLFHGIKWAYGVRNQLDNFNHANEVLMNALTLT